MRLIAPLIAAVLLSAAGSVLAQAFIPQVTPAVAAAVADPARPEADRARDAARKPGEVLSLIHMAPGRKVAEYMPGEGYFTRILSKAAGPTGKVYAYQPAEIVKLAPRYLTAIQAVAADPNYANVTVSSDATAAFATPEPVDLVFTALNYHDLHGRFAQPGTAEAFNAQVFKALKPGGQYVIIDHAAIAGSGTAGAALHRIDRAQVMREVVAAGFLPGGSNMMLANPDDPMTAGVFDPSIRGRTSQFILVFTKPR